MTAPTIVAQAEPELRPASDELLARFAPRTTREWAVLAIAVLLLLAVLAGPALATDPVSQSASGRLLPPSLTHPFGTDELRRDILARILSGLATSLVVSFLAVLPGALIGIALGFTAGYGGRLLDSIVMRVIDAWMAFPGVLSALAILTVLGPGRYSVALALMVFTVPVFTRLARAQMLAERRRDYVLAAVVLGASPVRIAIRHVGVNALPALITQLALSLNAGILIAAALSFLGLGEAPPNPSLGGLLNESRPHLRDAWWYVTFPAVTLAALLIFFNLAADVLNDRLLSHTRRTTNR